ncbi:MAG: hypothetical protein R2769_15355 [Saprospiraceae bacterium]
MPTKYTTAGGSGSVYGLAYDRFSKTLYTSAFLKRHVGMGPLGIGGLYKVTTNNPITCYRAFVDVKSIGINTLGPS